MGQLAAINIDAGIHYRTNLGGQMMEKVRTITIVIENCTLQTLLG